MIVPFAKEAYKRSRASTPEQTLLNLIVEVDDSDSTAKQQGQDKSLMLLQRPGLTAYRELPAGPVQGLLSTNNPAFNSTFAVAANKLYSVTADAHTYLGDVAGDMSRVSMAATYDRIAIVAAPNLYLYGGNATGSTPSFRQVPIPDFTGAGAPAAVAVAMLNNYLVVACADGTFLWLAPDDDAIDPLNFATAESSPDGLQAVAVLRSNLIFFGAGSTEIWQPSGNADLPFLRAQGLDYTRGCASRDSIVAVDNSIIWVGEDGKVYRASNEPERVSTDGIDERLKLRTGQPSAWSFSHDAHEFYVLNIPGQGTFALDLVSKVWSEFASGTGKGWAPRVGCFDGSTWLCGDSASGKVWSISDAATDDGQAMVRRASATVAVRSKPVRADNLVLDVGADRPCSFLVRWADADEQLADKPYIDLPMTRAGADALSLYRLGAARTPWRTLEVCVIDEAVVRISQARIGEAWR